MPAVSAVVRIGVVELVPPTTRLLIVISAGLSPIDPASTGAGCRNASVPAGRVAALAVAMAGAKVMVCTAPDVVELTVNGPLDAPST